MMDVEALVAIDVHVHAEVSASGHPSLPTHLREGAIAHFGAAEKMPTIPEIAAYYRELHLAAVIFTVDAEAATGHPQAERDRPAGAELRWFPP